MNRRRQIKRNWEAAELRRQLLQLRVELERARADEDYWRRIARSAIRRVIEVQGGER